MIDVIDRFITERVYEIQQIIPLEDKKTLGTDVYLVRNYGFRDNLIVRSLVDKLYESHSLPQSIAKMLQNEGDSLDVIYRDGDDTLCVRATLRFLNREME